MNLYIRECEPSSEQSDQLWAALKAVLSPPKVSIWYLSTLLSENNPYVTKISLGVSLNHCTKSLWLFIDNNLPNILHKVVHHWGHSLQTHFISNQVPKQEVRDTREGKPLGF